MVERIESDVSLILHLGLLETHPPKPIALKVVLAGRMSFALVTGLLPLIKLIKRSKENLKLNKKHQKKTALGAAFLLLQRFAALFI